MITRRQRLQPRMALTIPQTEFRPYQCTRVFYEGYALYLEGFITFGRTMQEHREGLSLVLSRLTEAGLKINPKECKLLQE